MTPADHLMKFKVYWTVAGYCTIEAETEAKADTKVEAMTAHNLLSMTDHTSTTIEYELTEAHDDDRE